MLISCKNLTVSYDGHPAIHHVSCGVESNKITAIIGPNGAGKSTLLKAFLGLVKVDTGNIHLNGICHSDMAYLPQITTINTLIPLQVLDVVCIGALKSINCAIKDNDVKFARECLDKVGLKGFEERYITDLSRGQLQRVLFAKIIMQKSKIIFLDEPFNAIDTKTTQDLLRLLVELKCHGTTIVLVLHDLLQVEECCDNAILLASELVSYGLLSKVLSQDNLKIAYNANFTWSSDICNKDISSTRPVN